MSAISSTFYASLDYDIKRLYEGAKRGPDALKRINHDIFEKYHLDLLKGHCLKGRKVGPLVSDLEDLSAIRAVALQQLSLLQKSDPKGFEKLLKEHKTNLPSTREALFTSLIYQMAGAIQEEAKLKALNFKLLLNFGCDLLNGRLCIKGKPLIKTPVLQDIKNPKALFTLAEHYLKLLEKHTPQYFKRSQAGSFEELAAALPSSFSKACRTLLEDLLIALDNLLKCLQIAPSSFAERSLKKEAASFFEAMNILRDLHLMAEAKVHIDTSPQIAQSFEHMKELLQDVKHKRSSREIALIKKGFYLDLEEGHTILRKTLANITTNFLELVKGTSDAAIIHEALEKDKGLPLKESLYLIGQAVRQVIHNMDERDKPKSVSGDPYEVVLEL